MEKNQLTDADFDRIKKHVRDFTIQDIIRWLEDMTNNDIRNNRLFDIINHEYLRRVDRKELTDNELNSIKENINRHSYADLFVILVEMISNNNTHSPIFKIIDNELTKRRIKGEINEEDNLKIKDYFSSYTYIDLIIWHNDLMDSGQINNQVYRLIEKEISDRSKDNRESQKNRL